MNIVPGGPSCRFFFLSTIDSNISATLYKESLLRILFCILEPNSASTISPICSKSLRLISSLVSSFSMLLFVLLCVIFVRNLSVENPGKAQLLLESAIGKGVDFFEDVMGKENRRYIPYLITVLIYIGIANIIGLFGFKPPTKDLNVTIALAVMSMCLIEYSGIHKNGLKHWVKHFAKPVPFVAPIMVLEIVIRPLSLCMRLFGNVLGAFVIMELLKIVAPAIIPIPFSFYFDIFDGFLQAYVFVFLTALFMNEEQE